MLAIALDIAIVGEVTTASTIVVVVVVGTNADVGIYVVVAIDHTDARETLIAKGKIAV